MADVSVEIGGEQLLAGQLWAHRRRGTESATFRYDRGYLANRSAYGLDPGLPLLEGPQQTSVGRAMFGAFSDCAPDRWGRRLIDRAEEHRVEEADSGAERSFGEAQYLLHVRDDLRQGALRFRVPGSDQWLASDRDGVANLLDLPTLLSASERLERDEATTAELKTLLRGGSSLGGARPKAHVCDRGGRIAIAKFPSPSADEWDVIRWEAVALRLAASAAINTARARLHDIDGKPVLIVERFDRAGQRRRLVARDAEAIVRDVAATTASWRTVAVDVALPDRAIDRMARAFEHDQLVFAQTL